MNNNSALGIAVLGSTGSIGIQTLEVASSIGARIDLLSGGSNDRLLEDQCRKFMPRKAVMSDSDAAMRLKTALADTDIIVSGGGAAVTEAAGETNADMAVIAISGMAAAMPMIAAAGRCSRLCMANKEAIVAAGAYLLSEIKKGGAELIPVDSEHSAIFQCLQAGRKSDVDKLILTASGGPFYGKSREELEKITPEMALAHPTWRMGKKITVDSATLMNKGFEVIEAMHLFSVKAESIEVVVHRESIIHSMVQYRDGAVVAQLGMPDMRTAIQYAITYPERTDGIAGKVDFAALSRLSFGRPDTEAFPLLALAMRAAASGGICPAVMSAADEIAVGEFLKGKLGFYGIYDTVADAVERIGCGNAGSLDDIISADRETREYLNKKLGIL